jgi:4-hydroxy-2-oxoheptanedioate aldolase
VTLPGVFSGSGAAMDPVLSCGIVNIPANTFKASLRSPTPSFGLWLALADPYSAELCAGAGFDWVVIDQEHAPNDLRSTLAQLQAVAPYPVQTIVRLPLGETHTIKQLLDIGAQTILIPMAESAEQVAEMVRAMRYPPAGVRGVGAAIARSSRWQAVPDYLQRANDEVCLLVQIETQGGLKNLEAIANVDGVDGLLIGPSDLAASFGLLGQSTHPTVQKAIQDAVARIRATGKAAGILGTDEKTTRDYIAFGCNFVAVGADTMLLAAAARELAQRYRT